MTIVKRLLIAFGVSLSVALAIGFLGLYSINSNSIETQNLVDRDVDFFNNVKKLKIEALQHRQYEKDFFLYIGEPEKQKKYIENFNKVSDRLKKRLQYIEKAGMEKINVDKETQTIISASISAYNTYHVSFIDLSKKVSVNSDLTPQMANKLMAPFKDQIYTFEKSIDKLEGMSQKRLETMVEYTALNGSKLKMIIMFCLLLGVLLISIIAFFTINRIRSGLALLSHESINVHQKDEEKHKFLHDNIPIPYQSLDSNGCFIDINTSWLKLLGYKRSDVVGKSFSSFLHPDYKAIFNKSYPKFKQKGCVSDIRLDIRHKKGHYLNISLTGNILRQSDGSFRETFCVFHDITDQIETRLELERSQNELGSIFRATPTGIGVVKNRVFSKVNDKFCEITGYSKEELLEKESRFLYPTDEEFEYVGTEKYRQINNSGSGSIETRFKRKDGEIIDILMSSTPLDINDLLIGVTFTALDITKRKNAENAVRESEEKYRSIMESMDDAAYICSSDYTIEYLNPAMEKLIGHNAVGEKCFEAIFGFDKKCSKCFLSRVEKGEIVKKERVIGKNHRTYFTSSSPVKKTDGSISKLSIFRDITDIKHMEERIQQAQKMEAIGTLAGGIAHDFNNILFPISGYSEILLDEISEESPLRESVNKIYSGAMRATELVKQILAFSRQESTELKIIKIQHIVKEAFKLLRSTIPSTIEFKQNIDTKCGAVKADPTQIHQIIMNLATNAYHAMENTGGELYVSLVEFELEKNDITDLKIEPGQYVCLTVKDTGVGITKDVVKKIFDPFFTTKKKGKGTGMGLSVVHGIVTSMGGVINVYSEPNVGTEVKIYFPAEKKAFQERGNSTELPIQGGREHIMIVDDEETIVLFEKQVLESLGYKVSSWTNSVEAFEAFKATPGSYDIVISDVTMPVLAGDKLALKIIAIRPDIPILLSTGFSETVTNKEIEELGVKGLLMKPIKKNELARSIRNILNQKK